MLSLRSLRYCGRLNPAAPRPPAASPLRLKNAKAIRAAASFIFGLTPRGQAAHPTLARHAIGPELITVESRDNDGYRAQVHWNNGQVSVFTRNGYDWAHRFASIAEGLKALSTTRCVLDGEIVVTDARGVSDFHLLQDELARNQSGRLTYLVFDLLYLDGFDVRGVILSERKRVLAQLLQNHTLQSAIQLNPHIDEIASRVFDQACAMHLEGIVSKDMNSPYRSGRQDSWLKLKCED